MDGGWQWMAIDGVMVTQWLWTRRQWMACWLDSNGRIDGNGRPWTANRRQWTVDGNGQQWAARQPLNGDGLASNGR